MTYRGEQQPEGQGAQTPDGQATRRQMLKLGAAAGTVILTVQPGIAQAASSVINCEIPVPDPARAGQAVMPDGSMVPAGTQGSFAGGRIFKGQDVRTALRGGMLPGTGYEESQAYLNYIRRLQYGRSGFTCYASLQMPRR